MSTSKWGVRCFITPSLRFHRPYSNCWHYSTFNYLFTNYFVLVPSKYLSIQKCRRWFPLLIHLRAVVGCIMQLVICMHDQQSCWSLFLLASKCMACFNRLGASNVICLILKLFLTTIQCSFFVAIVP
jgi:hypothetical protein